MKHFIAIATFYFIFLSHNLFGQESEHGFHKLETRNFIIEVSKSLPKSDLTEAKNAVLRAEKFFLTVFKMPAGILTGNLSENSAAFSKFKEKLKSETSFGGKIPKNLYEEWFKLAGKIEYRIWEKRLDFGTEFFDFFHVDQAEREKRGLPGAYFAWGRLGGTKDANSDELGKRIIRSFKEGREIKTVVASLYHEIGHLYLASYLMAFYRDLPPSWLAEGFAELFAYALPSDNKTKRKKLKNKAILFELVQQNDYWEFDKFLEIDNAHNLKLVAEKSYKSEIVYTQAWSVVDFLTSSSKYSQRFLKFLELLRTMNFKHNLLTSGKKQDFFKLQKIAFKEAFQADISELEKYWKNYVEVIYKKELTKNPENYYFIGDFYLRRNNTQKAEEFFAIAAEKAPEHSESHLGLGRLAYQRGQLEDAEQAFTNAVKADGENEEALAWLGYAQLGNKKYAEAEDSFRKSVELDPADENTLYGFGLALLRTKKYDEANTSFQEAYRRSSNPKHLFYQAQALFHLKEYTESRRQFSATSVKWANPEIPFWLGVTSAHLKENKYALEQLELAVKNGGATGELAKVFMEAINQNKPLPEIK